MGIFKPKYLIIYVGFNLFCKNITIQNNLSNLKYNKFKNSNV